MTGLDNFRVFLSFFFVHNSFLRVWRSYFWWKIVLLLHTGFNAWTWWEIFLSEMVSKDRGNSIQGCWRFCGWIYNLASLSEINSCLERLNTPSGKIAKKWFHANEMIEKNILFPLYRVVAPSNLQASLMRMTIHVQWSSNGNWSWLKLFSRRETNFSKPCTIDGGFFFSFLMKIFGSMDPVCVCTSIM